MIMSLGSYSHKDGDWGIWTCEDGISIYSIETDGVDGSLYDNWVLRKRQVESMLELGKEWIDAYERDKAEAQTYQLSAVKNVNVNGTSIVISREITISNHDFGLDEAKSMLLQEMEKVKLIKIGE